jgi:ATP-dependent helicase/nuclease subunit B
VATPASDTGASRRIYTVPPGEPFLVALARAILDGTLPGGGPADLPRLLLLLPTRRAVRAMREAFLSVSRERALLLPRIRPIAEGDEEASLILGSALPPGTAGDALSVSPQIAPLERRLVLTILVMAWARQQEARLAGDDQPGSAPTAFIRSPAQAANLAAELASLMDMVETEEADFGRLASLAPEEHSAYWQQTVEFLGIATGQLPAYLAKQGSISPAQRRRLLIESEARRLQAFPQPVIVAGVTGSVPATARLMRVVAGLPQGALVLPGLDMTLAPGELAAIARDAPSHPQHRLGQLLGALGASLADVGWLPGTVPGERMLDRVRFLKSALAPPEATAAWSRLGETLPAPRVRHALEGVSLIEAADAEEEAEAIALMLRRAAGDRDLTAALVTPDRILARRVAVRLESWGIRIDDSAGRPFAKTPPGTFLDLVAELIASRFHPAAVMALLKHPLARFALPASDARRAARAIELLAFRRIYLGEGLEGIRAALARSIDEADEGPLAPHPAIGRLGADDRERAEELIGRLEAAMAPLTSLKEASLAALAAAHAAAAEAIATDEHGSTDPLYAEEAGETASLLFAGLMDESLPHPTMRLAEYPELYRSLVSAEVVRPTVPAHPRLFIWGPFESRLLQPGLVILGGLNDGVWPEIAEPGPWLNRPMLRELGLPSPEARIGDSAHDFTSLLAAPRVIMTRALKSGGVPMVASRWLLRFEALLAGLGAADALAAEEPWLGWARNRDRGVPTGQLRAPGPRPALSLRPRQLSVTRIEDWIRNPYTIYARRILKLEPMPDLSGEPDGRLRGQMIHAALSRFSARFPADMPADAAGLLEQEALALLKGLAAHPRIIAFWQPRLRRFAEWFAESEVARRQDLARQIAEVTGALSFEAPGGPFRLTARADRIDILASGALGLTDYKSGSMPRKRQVISGEAPQLLLEAAIAISGGFDGLAREQRIVWLRYIRATGGEPPGEEMTIAGEDIAALAASALERTKRLVAQFDDPATPYRAVRRSRFKDAYRFDAYEHLARVEEWADAEGGGDE